MLHIFHCACAKRQCFHFWCKIWRYHRVPRPQFPIRRKNFGNSCTFKEDVELLIFAWIFRTFWLKMKFLGDKMGEGVVQCWSPTNSFLLFGVFASVPILVKIDQEMRLWECLQTDTLTHTPTQIGFIICPMLYAIPMGQIKTKARFSRLLWHPVWKQSASAGSSSSPLGSVELFYGLVALPVTQPSVSKHWGIHKALTLTSGLASSCGYPQMDSWIKRCCSLVMLAVHNSSAISTHSIWVN